MSFDFKHDDHSLKSNTMGDTSGAVTAYPPEASQTSHSRFVNSRYIFLYESISMTSYWLFIRYSRIRIVDAYILCMIFKYKCTYIYMQ
jgi:hypothetical protein